MSENFEEERKPAPPDEPAFADEAAQPAAAASPGNDSKAPAASYNSKAPNNADLKSEETDKKAADDSNSVIGTNLLSLFMDGHGDSFRKSARAMSAKNFASSLPKLDLVEDTKSTEETNRISYKDALFAIYGDSLADASNKSAPTQPRDKESLKTAVDYINQSLLGANKQEKSQALNLLHDPEIQKAFALQVAESIDDNSDPEKTKRAEELLKIPEAQERLAGFVVASLKNGDNKDDLEISMSLLAADPKLRLLVSDKLKPEGEFLYDPEGKEAGFKKDSNYQWCIKNDGSKVSDEIIAQWNAQKEPEKPPQSNASAEMDKKDSDSPASGQTAETLVKTGEGYVKTKTDGTVISTDGIPRPHKSRPGKEAEFTIKNPDGSQQVRIGSENGTLIESRLPGGTRIQYTNGDVQVVDTTESTYSKNEKGSWSIKPKGSENSTELPNLRMVNNDDGQLQLELLSKTGQILASHQLLRNGAQIKQFNNQQIVRQANGNWMASKDGKPVAFVRGDTEYRLYQGKGADSANTSWHQRPLTSKARYDYSADTIKDEERGKGGWVPIQDASFQADAQGNITLKQGDSKTHFMANGALIEPNGSKHSFDDYGSKIKTESPNGFVKNFEYTGMPPVLINTKVSEGKFMMVRNDQGIPVGAFLPDGSYNEIVKNQNGNTEFKNNKDSKEQWTLNYDNSVSVSRGESWKASYSENGNYKLAGKSNGIAYTVEGRDSKPETIKSGDNVLKIEYAKDGTVKSVQGLPFALDTDKYKHISVSTDGKIKAGANQTEIAFKISADGSITRERFTAANRQQIEVPLSKAHNWTHGDLNSYLSNPNSDTLNGLRSVTQLIPEETRKSVLKEQTENLLNGNGSERLLAVKVIQAFSTDASKEQVSALKSFSGKEGKELLAKATLNTNEIQEFQRDAGVALLRIAGGTDKHVSSTAREILSTQEFPGLEDSNLKIRLLAYATSRTDTSGNPVVLNDPEKQVARDLGIPQPLWETFKDLGIKGTDAELAQFAQKAVENYGLQDVHRAISNVATVNILNPNANIDPAHVALAMAENKLDKSLLQDFSKLQINGNRQYTSQINEWNSKLLAAQSNKDLISKYLLEKNKDYSPNAGSKIEQMAHEINSYVNQADLNQIKDPSLKAAIALGKAVDIFANAKDEPYEYKFKRWQDNLVEAIKSNDASIKESAELINEARQRQSVLQFSQMSGALAQTAMSDPKQADEISLRMLSAFGSKTLQELNPNAAERAYKVLQERYGDLAGNSLDTLKQSQAQGEKAAMSAAAEVLKQIRDKNADGSFATEKAALLKLAFDSINSDKRVKDLMLPAAEFSEHFGSMASLYAIGSNGGRGEKLVQETRERAGKLKEALDKVGQAEIDGFQESLKTLRQTRAQMQEKGDRDTYFVLDTQIKSMEAALKLFNPNSPENKQARKQIDSLLNKDDFNETNLAEFLKDTGKTVAVIAVTVTVGAFTGGALAAYAGIMADELAKEGLRAWGGRKEGSRLFDYARGKQVYNEETGKMERMDFADDVLFSYAQDFATNYAMAKVGQAFAHIKQTPKALNATEQFRLGFSKTTGESISKAGTTQKLYGQFKNVVGEGLEESREEIAQQTFNELTKLLPDGAGDVVNSLFSPALAAKGGLKNSHGAKNESGAGSMKRDMSKGSAGTDANSKHKQFSPDGTPDTLSDPKVQTSFAEAFTALKREMSKMPEYQKLKSELKDIASRNEDLHQREDKLIQEINALMPLDKQIDRADLFSPKKMQKLFGDLSKTDPNTSSIHEKQYEVLAAERKDLRNESSAWKQNLKPLTDKLNAFVSNIQRNLGNQVQDFKITHANGRLGAFVPESGKLELKASTLFSRSWNLANTVSHELRHQEQLGLASSLVCDTLGIDSTSQENVEKLIKAFSEKNQDINPEHAIDLISNRKTLSPEQTKLAHDLWDSWASPQPTSNNKIKQLDKLINWVQNPSVQNREKLISDFMNPTDGEKSPLLRNEELRKLLDPLSKSLNNTETDKISSKLWEDLSNSLLKLRDKERAKQWNKYMDSAEIDAWSAGDKIEDIISSKWLKGQPDRSLAAFVIHGKNDPQRWQELHEADRSELSFYGAHVRAIDEFSQAAQKDRSLYRELWDHLSDKANQDGKLKGNILDQLGFYENPGEIDYGIDSKGVKLRLEKHLGKPFDQDIEKMLVDMLKIQRDDRISALVESGLPPKLIEPAIKLTPDIQSIFLTQSSPIGLQSPAATGKARASAKKPSADDLALQVQKEIEELNVFIPTLRNLESSTTLDTIAKIVAPMKPLLSDYRNIVSELAEVSSEDKTRESKLRMQAANRLEAISKLLQEPVELASGKVGSRQEFIAALNKDLKEEGLTLRSTVQRLKAEQLRDPLQEALDTMKKTGQSLDLILRPADKAIEILRSAQALTSDFKNMLAMPKRLESIEHLLKLEKPEALAAQRTDAEILLSKKEKQATQFISSAKIEKELEAYKESVIFTNSTDCRYRRLRIEALNGTFEMQVPNTPPLPDTRYKDFESGYVKPLTEPLEIPVISANGVQSTIVIPKHCLARISGPDLMVKTNPSQSESDLYKTNDINSSGITFVDPTPQVFPDGRKFYREYRISPRAQSNGSDYKNGYLRVSNVFVDSSDTFQKRSYLTLNENGKLIYYQSESGNQWDGRRWGFHPTNYSHKTDLHGGLMFAFGGNLHPDFYSIKNPDGSFLSSEQLERLQRQRAQVAGERHEYQYSTHFYLLPPDLARKRETSPKSAKK